jgi:hypothetical protein
MSDATQSPGPDPHAQVLRIDRAIAKTARYTAGTAKSAAEQRKPETEARRFDHNRWQILVTAMTAGAAFLKLLTL